MLASVNKIENITKLEKSLWFDLGYVGGQDVLIRKNKFKIGEAVLLVKRGAIVPKIEEFSFLKSKNYVVGLFKDGDLVSNHIIAKLPPGEYKEGEDVSKKLGFKNSEKVSLLNRVISWLNL